MSPKILYVKQYDSTADLVSAIATEKYNTYEETIDTLKRKIRGIQNDYIKLENTNDKLTMAKNEMATVMKGLRMENKQFHLVIDELKTLFPNRSESIFK